MRAVHTVQLHRAPDVISTSLGLFGWSYSVVIEAFNVPRRRELSFDDVTLYLGSRNSVIRILRCRRCHATIHMRQDSTT